MLAAERPYRILIGDDQPAVLDALKMLFRSEGFEVETARSPKVILESLSMREYEMLLLDMNYARDTTSGREGLDLIKKIKEADNHVPIIVMTAWATIDLAVEAVRRGAHDFLQKPWDDEKLLVTVKTHAQLYRALRRGLRLEAENRIFRNQSKVNFIAESPAMRPVVEAITQVGPSDANVLITGEHGTGKEVVAQMLHALSQRADRPLIAVNTGGLPEGTFAVSYTHLTLPTICSV